MSSVPFYISKAISEYHLCKRFKVLPTAPTLYQEKARKVALFQIIEATIADEEEREMKKQQKKKGGKR